MKKILCTAVSALALAAFADGVNSTEFGVLQVPSKSKETIVGVPWLASGTSDVAVNVADLVLTAGLSEGDTLDLYSGSEYTASWSLTDGVWERGKGSTTTIPRGSAIKLTRKVYSSGFYIMGKPATAGVETSLGTGYSLVAPPAVSETDVNTGIAWTGVVAGDRLLLPDTNGTEGFVSLSWKDGTGWRKWVSGQGWVSTDIKIPAGTGAWFLNSGTGTKSFKYPKTAE